MTSKKLSPLRLKDIETGRREERKAILSFIEEVVDWDGVDYEKLTNWIRERGV